MYALHSCFILEDVIHYILGENASTGTKYNLYIITAPITSSVWQIFSCQKETTTTTKCCVNRALDQKDDDTSNVFYVTSKHHSTISIISLMIKLLHPFIQYVDFTKENIQEYSYQIITITFMHEHNKIILKCATYVHKRYAVYLSII